MREIRLLRGRLPRKGGGLTGMLYIVNVIKSFINLNHVIAVMSVFQSRKAKCFQSIFITKIFDYRYQFSCTTLNTFDFTGKLFLNKVTKQVYSIQAKDGL